MSRNPSSYQPGAILYDVVLGLLRAKGTNFDRWCETNGTTPSSARNAVYGQSSGARGQDLRERLIKAAGEDLVRQAYAERIRRHADEFIKHNQTKGAA